MVRIPDDGDFTDRIKAEAEKIAASGSEAPATEASFKVMLEAGIDPEGLAYQTMKALLKALRGMEEAIPQGDVSEAVKTLVVSLDKVLDLFIEDLEAHMAGRAMEELKNSDLGSRIRATIAEQVEAGKPKGQIELPMSEEDMAWTAKMLARLGIDELPGGAFAFASQEVEVPDFPPDDEVQERGSDAG